MEWLLVWLFFTIIIGIFGQSADRITVQTKYGLVRGKIATTIVENREFYEFLGIPFAKPPNGNLRFKVSKGSRASIK